LGNIQEAAKLRVLGNRLFKNPICLRQQRVVARGRGGAHFGDSDDNPGPGLPAAHQFVGLHPSGAMMSARPVGVLFMEDEAGLDEKIIAVPSARLTKRYDSIKSYSDLPEISVQQVKHFFEHYKDLENEKWVKVTHWGGVEDAHRLILECCARAEK
jgi:hypothetical protein